MNKLLSIQLLLLLHPIHLQCQLRVRISRNNHLQLQLQVPPLLMLVLLTVFYKKRKIRFITSWALEGDMGGGPGRYAWSG